MYFKGFAKVRDQWDEEAWETRCSEVLSEAIDECIAEALEMAEYFPKKFRNEIIEDAINDVMDIEKTFRYLKAENIASEDIEYVLNETTDYYSDRHLNKIHWLDEQPKEWMSRYPQRKDGVKGGKRVRAREDEWFTMTVCLIL
jgi:hypothetical protein